MYSLVKQKISVLTLAPGIAQAAKPKKNKTLDFNRIFEKARGATATADTVGNVSTVFDKEYKKRKERDFLTLHLERMMELNIILLIR